MILRREHLASSLKKGLNLGTNKGGTKGAIWMQQGDESFFRGRLDSGEDIKTTWWRYPIVSPAFIPLGHQPPPRDK